MKAATHPEHAEAACAGLPSEARLVEVFSSIQGEGAHVGKRHIFIRFFGCNLHCFYCDTPESLSGSPPCRIQTSPGSPDLELPNPVGLDVLLGHIRTLSCRPHDAVSLTGGEPLLQAGFLAGLLPRIRELGLPTYLETNGVLPGQLRRVVQYVDTVAMDLKMPSTLRGGRDWLPEHREFLREAAVTDVFCKVVLPPSPDWEWLQAASRMVAQTVPGTPFVIQPLTPFADCRRGPSAQELLAAYEVAREHLDNVRIIPQTHKMAGLR